MKSIQLLVRDDARSILGTVSPPWAAAIMGALAADPETIGELDLALQRFQIDAPPDAWRKTFVERQDDRSIAEFRPKSKTWGGIIDLPARMVFWNGGPGPETGLSTAPLMDRGKATTTELTYEFPRQWRIVAGWDGWFDQLLTARNWRADHPPIDAREVLYDGMPEWMAEALCEAQQNGETNPVATIHAAWLTLTRDDLGGRTPREVLVADLESIGQEIERRSGEWSRLGRPPVELPKDSRAYRFGGIGLHEFIMYYDLVRHLLERAWQERPGELRDCDTLAVWLRAEQQNWLSRTQQPGTPDAYSPRDVIDAERQWLPLTANPTAAIVDCDCPLCQMMAEENFGPTFVHFDSVHFDPEFVFSAYPDRESWQLDYGMFGRDEPDEPPSEFFRESGGKGSSPFFGPVAIQRLSGSNDPNMPNTVAVRMSLDDLRISEMGRPSTTLPPRRSTGSPSERLWANSFIAPTPASASRQMRLQSSMFEVAAHGTELRDDVRASPEHFELMLRVLEDFANLRAAMREGDVARVGRLTDKCVELLNKLGVARRDVAEKCADLERSFRRLEKTIAEQ